MNDDNLLKALALYEEKWLASYPSDEELARMYTLSPRFERQMARWLSRQRKPYYPYVNKAWKRTLIAATVALLLFAASMSVSAIRQPVVRFMVEVYEKCSSLFYQEKQEIGEEANYRPTYLPEGFSLISENLLDAVVILRYENAEGKSVVFRQYPLRSYELQINTEGLQYEDILIGAEQGVFYTNKGWNNLAWNDGSYAFILIAEIDKQDMLRIAESVDIAEQCGIRK